MKAKNRAVRDIDLKGYYDREMLHQAQPIRTYKQVGAIVGLTASAVCAAELKALAKIRKGLIEAGLVDENGRLRRGVEA